MNDDCRIVPCEQVKQLEKDFQEFVNETEKRLAKGDTTFAVINTKLNWLIGILGCIGATCLTAVLKLVFSG